MGDIYVGGQAPFPPGQGNIWYKPDTNEMYIYDGVNWRQPYVSGGAGQITSPATTAAAGANNGSTPPAPVLTGDDTRGNITFGTGTGAAAGAQVVVTFGTAYGGVPGVSLTANNAGSEGLSIYVSSVTATGFTVSCTGTPTSGQGNTVFSVDYEVLF